MGGALAWGPPRITLHDAGLQIDYAWPRGGGGLLLATAAGMLALTFGARWLRAGTLALAAGGLLVGLGLLAYRLEANDSRLSVRSLLGETSIAWSDVTRVEAGAHQLVVWGEGKRRFPIETSSFRPAQRASLERTVARRVRERSALGAPASNQ